MKRFHTPSEVGLGNVDNTSDADKPISDAVDGRITTFQVTQALKDDMQDDAIDGKADADHTHTWGDLIDTPSEFPPESHTHSAAQITSGAFPTARLADTAVTEPKLSSEVQAKLNSTDSISRFTSRSTGFNTGPFTSGTWTLLTYTTQNMAAGTWMIDAFVDLECRNTGDNGGITVILSIPASNGQLTASRTWRSLQGLPPARPWGYATIIE